MYQKSLDFVVCRRRKIDTSVYGAADGERDGLSTSEPAHQKRNAKTIADSVVLDPGGGGGARRRAY